MSAVMEFSHLYDDGLITTENLSSADEWVFRYLRQTVGHVHRHWGSHTDSRALRSTDDLFSVAMESLVTHAVAFEADMAAKGIPDLDGYGGMFYKSLMQRVDWDISKHLDRVVRERQADDASFQVVIGDTDDEKGADGDYVRTEMSRFAPPSMLQQDIVDYVRTLPRRAQIILALTFFENLNQRHIGPLAGVHETYVSSIIRTATRAVRWFAVTQISTNPDWDNEPTITERRADITAELTQWVAHHYRTDVHTWLGWVTLCYRVDVGYLTDFLWRANGVITQNLDPGPNNRTRKISDDSRTTIRARLAAGEMQKDLALEYGVTQGAISYIKNAPN